MRNRITTCVNIFGGSNLILPNVTQVYQHKTAAEYFAAARKRYLRYIDICEHSSGIADVVSATSAEAVHSSFSFSYEL